MAVCVPKPAHSQTGRAAVVFQCQTAYNAKQLEAERLQTTLHKPTVNSGCAINLFDATGNILPDFMA
jgi:hypothetical protein